MFKSSARPCEVGFTLLEVLVALTVLSIGLLGAAGLTTGVIKGNFYSKNVTTATIVATTTLEEVQRIGYDDAETLAGATSVTMGGAAYTRVTSVSPNTPDSNMKTVTVTVSWNPGNHSVSLNTIISE